MRQLRIYLIAVALLGWTTDSEADCFVDLIDPRDLTKIGAGFRTPGDPNHLGVDLGAASAGKPVYAITDGSVSLSSTNLALSGFGAWCDQDGTQEPGPLIVLRHRLLDGSFFHALYGHVEPSGEILDILDGLAPNEVLKGDIIGTLIDFKYCGQSFPHTHFGIWLADSDPHSPYGYDSNQRQYVNPDDFIESEEPFPIAGPEPEFDFALDWVSVGGNISSGFFDDFDDGFLTRLPTSRFSCIQQTKELADHLRLRSCDGANTFTPAFLVDNCQLGVAPGAESTLLMENKGDATITASFRADPPLEGQAYGVQLFTAGGGENVSIQVGNFGAGTIVTGFVVKTGFAQSVPVNLGGVDRILLRLFLDDQDNNRVFPSFSTNGGNSFTPINLPASATVFDSANQAVVSIFGSVIVD